VISTKKKGAVTEALEALPVVGTLNVDTNTYTPTGKEGAELLAEAAAEPTIDIYLDRSPKLGAPVDYPAMVALLQRKRELFITAEANKKAGVKPEEKTEDEAD